MPFTRSRQHRTARAALTHASYPQIRENSGQGVPRVQYGSSEEAAQRGMAMHREPPMVSRTKRMWLKTRWIEAGYETEERRTAPKKEGAQRTPLKPTRAPKHRKR